MIEDLSSFLAIFLGFKIDNVEDFEDYSFEKHDIQENSGNLQFKQHNYDIEKCLENLAQILKIMNFKMLLTYQVLMLYFIIYF